MLVRNFVVRAALVVVVVGCQKQGGTEETGTGGSSDGSGEVPTTGGSESGSSGSTGGGGGPEGFGFACVDLARGEGVEGDPFAGTQKIVVTLDYQPCLIDYYINKSPDMRQTGTKGAFVFEHWKDRLCTEAVTGRIDCEVESLEQVLMETGTEAYRMTATYVTPQPDQLDGRTVLWGPAPLTDYAGCAEGLEASASLSSLSGVIGLDADGATIWQVQSFGGGPGLIHLGDGGCIRAHIAPL